MPLAPTFNSLFDTLRRSAVGGLRMLLVVSTLAFAGQQTGALAAHHMMSSGGAATAIPGTDNDSPQAETTQPQDAGCCQPVEEQPACPDCVAVSCAATAVTIPGGASIQIFLQPLRHLFFDPAFVLSSHSEPPEPEPPRA